MRRIGAYFDGCIEDLSEQLLLDYFSDLLATHSWSAVKLDLDGLKFYYAHVLRKLWGNVDLVKPPKGQRLPDIVRVEDGAVCSSEEAFVMNVDRLDQAVLEQLEDLVLPVGLERHQSVEELRDVGDLPLDQQERHRLLDN